MTKINRIEWSELTASLARGNRRWQQGQHVSIIGSIGAGKTYLGLRLLMLHQYLVIFGSKPQDKELTTFARKHSFSSIDKWPPHITDERVIVWPKYRQPGDEAKQRIVFANAIGGIFYEGAWTLFVDEVFYWCDRLRLKDYLQAVWLQGRSLHLSLVAATQRPKGVPLTMYDQPTHLFFFRYNDKNDLDRIGNIGYLNRNDIRDAVARLDRYEFLYIHVPSGYMAISKAEG